MILQSLVQLATAEKLIADPDFEFKPVAWIVRLTNDGGFIGVEDNRINLNEGQTDKRGKAIKPRWIGRDVLVPIQGIRTSGDAEAFLVDKADYAVGVDPAGKRPESKLLNRMRLFYAAVSRCAGATNDIHVHALAAFGRSLLASSCDERVKLLPKECGPSDLIMFRVGDCKEPVHLLKATKAHWKHLRSPEAPPGPIGNRRCLITGCLIVGDVGLFRLLKNVPGGTTSGVSLVSFNSSAWESQGWKGSENAPVAREAAEAAATALNRLLDSSPINGEGMPLPVRRIRLNNDTVVVFWSPEEAADVQTLLDSLPDLLDPRDEAADVANLVASYRTGKLRPLKEPGRFYALTLTGTQGRAILRDWLESSVADIQKSVSQYFEDINIVRSADTGVIESPPTLRDAKLAAFRTLDDVPAPFGRDWLRVVWTGRKARVPLGIASRVTTRVRIALARGEKLSSHAFALLKLYLVRQGDMDMKSYLNEDHPSAAYHCGRLLAVLDFAQQRALGSTNTTNVRRMLGAIMTAPALYLGRIRSMTEKAYLPKLEGNWPRFLRDRIQSISGQVRDTMPRLLTMRDQSTFFLGMDQERTFLDTHPPSEYRWQTPVGLWVRSRGEHDVVRALVELGHTFTYEPGLQTSGYRDRLPDFMVLPSLGKADADRTFIEYLGMLDKQDYRERWEKKLAEYAVVGIEPTAEGGAAGKLLVLDHLRHPDYTSIYTELRNHLGQALSEEAIRDPEGAIQ